MTTKRNKPWNVMTFNQKRHTLYTFIKSRTAAFWKVCGKETQKIYQAMPYTEETIDSVRDEIIKLYLDRLNGSNLLDKEIKLKYLKSKLMKGED